MPTKHTDSAPPETSVSLKNTDQDLNETWRGSGEDDLIRDPGRGVYYPERHDQVSLQDHDSTLQSPALVADDVLSRSPNTLTRQQMLDSGQFFAADARTDSQVEAVAQPALEQMADGRLREHPYPVPDDALSRQSFDHHKNFADTDDVVQKHNGRDTSAHSGQR